MYDFTISNISGDSMGLPDTLSRITCAAIIPRLNGYTATEKNELLDLVHNAYVGHSGVDQIWNELVTSEYKWPNMRADALAFVAACWVCQKCRLGQGSVDAARKVITVTTPFSDIQMDTIGPLSENAYGNKYIINWVCMASGAFEITARPDTSARSALLSLIEVDCRYGPPKVIRTDRGSQFNNSLLKSYFAYVNTAQEFTKTPYTPMQVA